MNWTTKRRKPYTALGIKRIKCIRCGGMGHAQWNICADNGFFRVLCKSCDTELNQLVLEWAKNPRANELVKEYREKNV